eukprot:TRINITY_DN8888_c0_g1_i11.p1 TRINITY_DN8888_c0_g1~~TRINITY_DN8888_c0_g1_i11.p1  ORF type:complete len:602 (-),score=65.45 TRINITY_DN8888_c0_g1_i11:110-1915(-)
MTPAKLCIAAPLAVVAFATALPDAESSEARQIQDAGLHFHRMLEWLESGIREAGLGDDSRPPLADTFQLQHGIYGLSLVSKRSIQSGSRIAVLPFSRTISKPSYSKVQLEGFGSGMDADTLQDLQFQVLLARERRLGSSSTWAPYINTLPKSYNHLPYRWNDSGQHPPEGLACSSSFFDYLRHQGQAQRTNEREMSIRFGIDVEDFSWAADILSSRTWNDGGNTFAIPLFDLMNHDNHPNIAIAFDYELQGVELHALRRISPGEELVISYKKRPKTWQMFQRFGFLTPDTTPWMRLRINGIQQQSAQEKILGRQGAAMPADFVLSTDTTTKHAKLFLSYLRFLAEGGPTHEEVEAGGLAEDVAPSTWAAEKLALEIGSEILRDALASYKDIQVNSIEAHARNQYLKMLCESDRLALQWWLEVLQRGLRMAGTNESRADLTYLHDPWHAQLWNYVQEEFFWCWYLHRAAADAWAEHPFELLLVAFGCATLRRGFIMFVRFGILSCCRHSRTSVAGIFDNLCSLSSWWVCLGSLVALASAVSMQRSNHLFQFVLIATLALELCFNSDTLAQLLRLISIILCCSAVLASIYFAANAGADDVTIQ